VCASPKCSICETLDSHQIEFEVNYVSELFKVILSHGALQHGADTSC